MINVYSTTHCGACKTVKMYLESNGLVEGEHFNYINIDNDEEARNHITSLYSSVPVTEYNGEHILGFEMSELDTFIEQVKS